MGVAAFPPQRAVTALVGQVTIPTSDNEYVNVEVLHRVVGLDADDVRQRASTIDWGPVQFHVMNPFDVLASRVENLKQVLEKRNAHGVTQTHLAVLVAHEYIVELIQADDEKAALKAIERVASIAKSSAGRSASREFRITFLPAIPKDSIRNESFRTIRRPRMLEELRQAAGHGTVSFYGDQDDAEADGSENVERSRFRP